MQKQIVIQGLQILHYFRRAFLNTPFSNIKTFLFEKLVQPFSLPNFRFIMYLSPFFENPLTLDLRKLIIADA